MAFNLSTLLLALFLLASGIRLSKCVKFNITNYCKETIWPGVTPRNNFTGGFALKPSESAVFTAPPAWKGRIWARTGCKFDKTGNGSCQTGECLSALQCSGPGQPPATIAGFSLGDIDYYSVSLVDGFNLPVVIKPVSGKGNCSSAGCDTDLRPNCPPELTLKSEGKTVACKSACNVFNTDEYCCRGAFSTPVACLPTNYSRTFKAACPAAYSFAYDDPTSIITCSATDYTVTFCSSRNQSQCPYHDNRLICNGTSGTMLKEVMWKLLLMAAVAVGIRVPVFV